MRSTIRICLIMAAICTPALADIPSDGTLTFNNDSGLKTISSNAAAPTQIFTNEAFIARSWIVNRSSWVTVYVSSISANATPNAGFPIPPNTVFTPDGPTVPYWGALFAVGTGTGAPSGVDLQIGVMRTK